MANTTVASASVKQAWEDKFFAEYVRDSLFNSAMGMDENSIIQVKEQLTKSAGDKINIPLITRLTGTGVTGDSTLEGNEEALGNYNHQLTVNQLRHAVRVGGMEQQRTEMDLLGAARSMLKLWSMDKLRTDIINAMASPVVDGKTTYANSTSTQRNAWAAANSDRLLFGAATSNYSATFATALGNVDSTSDKLTTDAVTLMKYIAKTASPHIRPVKVKNGAEVFVMYAGSLPFRDLRTSITTPMQYAGERGDGNVLFADGDLFWDGVIIKEVPEIPVISGAGNNSIDVGQVFFCGAQAIALGWAQRTQFKTKSFDYENEDGVAIREIRGVEKPTYNNKPLGIVNGYFSAVAG